MSLRLHSKWTVKKKKKHLKFNNVDHVGHSSASLTHTPPAAPPFFPLGTLKPSSPPCFLSPLVQERQTKTVKRVRQQPQRVFTLRQTAVCGFHRKLPNSLQLFWTYFTFVAWLVGWLSRADRTKDAWCCLGSRYFTVTITAHCEGLNTTFITFTEEKRRSKLL